MEEKLIEKILQPANLIMACREEIHNKGAGGVDGMKVNELEEYLHEHRATLTEQIRSRNYHAQAIRGREIPKGGGKMRLLGIPTAIDRMLQQAVLRVVMPRYEQAFSGYSYGFRPRRNTQQAVSKSLHYINSGYQYVVEIDLKQFFDKVDHVLLLKLPINRDKSGIRRPVQFQILGYSFVPVYKKGVKGKYQFVVALKRWKSFKAKLKEVTRKTTLMSFDERIKRLNETSIEL